jgi:hypothetical protein
METLSSPVTAICHRVDVIAAAAAGLAVDCYCCWLEYAVVAAFVEKKA